MSPKLLINFCRKNAKKFIFILLFFCCLSIYAKDKNIEQGWVKFNNNDRKGAIELFQKALTQSNEKAEAALGLSMVYRANEDYEKAFDAFMQFFNNSTDPYPYTVALWTSGCVFSDYAKKTVAQVKFLEKMINDPKANGTVKSMANYMLANHYKDINKYSESLKYFSKIGEIQNWQSVGCFENISASGFNKDWGPLNKPEPSAIFKNKVNAEVKWFNVPQARNDRWLDLEYHYSTSNSVIYAQTFVSSPSEQECYLRSGNSGSLKIWLNDQLITSIEEERNCDLDIYSNKITLNKGVNRLLVQIGESEANNSNFLIRITDLEGFSLNNITSSYTYQPYSKKVTNHSENIPFWVESYFEEKLNKEPSLLNHILLAEIYLRNDKKFESKKILNHARTIFPNSSYIGIKLIEAAIRDDNQTDQTKEQERMKSLDSMNIYTLKLKIEEEENKENYDLEEKLVNQLVKLYGDSYFSDLKKIELLANRKQTETLLRKVEELYVKYPDYYGSMELKYLLTSRQGKDLAALNKVLLNYSKLKYSEKVYSTLAQNYFKMGNKAAGLKIYLERVNKMPYAVGYIDNLTELHFSLENYKEALIWAKKALELAPYHSFYWEKLGKVYNAQKDIPNAKMAYKKAIYFQPTNYKAREVLRNLEGKKKFFESFEKENIEALYKKSPKATEFPEAHSHILLYDIQHVVYPEGGSEQRVEYLIKPFNKNGIDEWKEFIIGYNSNTQRLIIENAQVLKSDGNKVQAERNKNQLVFTNLQENDAIHISYRLEDYSSGKLATQFWNTHNFNLYLPVGISRYSLILPKNKKFEYKLHQVDIKPSTSELDDYTLYTWKATDMEAIKSEPYTPPLSDIGKILEVSSIPDWNYVSEWYSDLSSTKAKADYEVKETIKELFPDANEKLNEFQKAKRIYQYIADNIRYSNVSFLHSAFVPQKASRTISTKLGDCKDVSTLFVAMTKEVGIKANLILISTRDNGEKNFTLPSIAFNHCIVTAQLDGLSYTFELTDQNLSFNSIPLELYKSISLVIPKDEENTNYQLEQLICKNKNNNTIFRESEIQIQEKDMLLKRKFDRIGCYAAYSRNSYRNIGKEMQEKKLTQGISSDFTTPVKLLDFSFTNLDNLSDTITYNYSCQISDEVKEIMGINILKLPWTDAYGSLKFVSLDKRNYPFNLWNFDGCEYVSETIVLNLPIGKTFSEIPPSRIFNCSAYEFSIDYKKISNNKLIATRKMKLLKDIVDVEEYDSFKDFCKKVSDADGKHIGFK